MSRWSHCSSFRPEKRSLGQARTGSEAELKRERVRESKSKPMSQANSAGDENENIPDGMHAVLIGLRGHRRSQVYVWLERECLRIILLVEV